MLHLKRLDCVDESWLEQSRDHDLWRW